MAEAQIRAYDPRRGDYALDLPAQPGPAASDLDRVAWWLSNLQMTRPGITASVMPIRPRQMGSIDDILRDIRGRMAMLLQSKAPLKEPDPRIIAQIARANALGTRPYAEGQHVNIESSYSPNQILDRWSASMPRSDIERIRPRTPWMQAVAPNLMLSPHSNVMGGFGFGSLPILSMKTDWFGPTPGPLASWELMRRGLYP